MKLPIKCLLALLALGATLAISASESPAQTGGNAFPGFNNANSGNSNLFAPATGGPASRSINPTADSLPGNLGQPAIGGNTIKGLAGNAPAPAPAAATTTTTNVTTTGTNTVAGVAPGLSTVNPVSILGNGFGGFPPQFNPLQPNQTSCRNVIDLVVRHCIGNNLFNANGQPGPFPAFFGGFPPPRMFPPIFPGQVLGDLELMGVNVVSEGAPNVGPVYQVTFRNNSQFALQNFQISLVAVLGTINEFSPSVWVNVPVINAGETGNIQIQLPANVMAMGVPTQPLVPFDTLVVAVDSFNTVMEYNELNNIATLKRVGIPVLVSTPATSQVATTTTTTAPTVQAAPAAPGPNGSSVPNPSATGPAPAPSDTVAPKPNDKLNLDNLDFGDANSAPKQASR